MPLRVLDLGGNIGFGAVFLAKAFPGCSLAIVEPDRRNVPVLRHNLEANAVSAKVIEAAIGSESGKSMLRFGKDRACSSLVGTDMHKDLPLHVEVKVVTVPQVMSLMQWGEIDLLKVDIEGAEEALLTRNNHWLCKVKAMLVEVHPSTTYKRLNESLRFYGLRLDRFGDGQEPVYFAQRVAAQ